MMGTPHKTIFMAPAQAVHPASAPRPIWVKKDTPDANTMSALPPKADMCSARGDVRFVPIADIPRMSLNHNVCSREQRRRDGEPKRFGSFQD